MEQKAGSVKQHDREGELSDDQRAAKPPIARRPEATASGRLERTGEPVVGRAERRQEPREKACDDRDAGSECENGGVHANRIDQAQPPQSVHLGGDSAGHPEGHQQTETAAAEPQQERFRHELPDDAASSGPECAVYGDLLPPGRRPGEKQAGHVRAGNQEHEPDGSKEQQERCPDVADEDLVERPRREAHSGVRLGEAVFEAAAERAELGSSRLHGCHRAKAAEHAHVGVVLPPGRAGCREVIAAVPQRQPHGALPREVETGGHDADHSVRGPIEPDRSADHARIGSEPLPPQRVTEHDHAFLAGLVLLAMERPAKNGPHLEYVEELRADGPCGDPSRLAGARQRHLDLEHGRQRCKGGCPMFLQAHEVRRRETPVALPSLDERFERQQPVRLVERQRPQEDPMDDAEDRRRQPDAERERDHGCDGEARASSKRPGRIPEILAGLLQQDPSPHGASILDDERDVADVAPRRGSRLLLGQAAALRSAASSAMWKAELLPKVGFLAAPPGRPAQFAEGHAHRFSLPIGRRPRERARRTSCRLRDSSRRRVL